MMQAFYWILLGHLLVLSALLTFVGRIAGPAMLRTMLAIFASGAISFALASQMVWTNETYALAMMCVDGLAATVVLLYPAGRAQSVIGLTFLMQMAVYTARLFRGDALDPLAYWWLLSILAFLQLFVAGGWLLHDVGSWRPYLGRGRAAARAAHRKSMDG